MIACVAAALVDHAAVIVGFDRHINYYKIQYAQLCINENPGCQFIATNLDAVTHLTDAQEWAGNGSMVGAIKARDVVYIHACIYCSNDIYIYIYIMRDACMYIVAAQEWTGNGSTVGAFKARELLYKRTHIRLLLYASSMYIHANICMC